VTDRLSASARSAGDGAAHQGGRKLQELAGASEQMFVVTAVPDEKKSERLIVLHTVSEEQLAECLAGLAKSELPALWRPRRDQFVRIDKLPYLERASSTCAKPANSRWKLPRMSNTLPGRGPFRFGVLARVVATIAALGIWFWTQSMIGSRAPSHGIDDALQDLFSG